MQDLEFCCQLLLQHELQCSGQWYGTCLLSACSFPASCKIYIQLKEVCGFIRKPSQWLPASEIFRLWVWGLVARAHSWFRWCHESTLVSVQHLRDFSVFDECRFLLCEKSALPVCRRWKVRQFVYLLFCFLIRIPVSFHHVKSFLSGRQSSVYHEEGDHGRHLGRHHPGVVGSNSILSLHTSFPLHSNAVHILHLHHVLETAANIFSFCWVLKTQCVWWEHE